MMKHLHIAMLAPFGIRPKGTLSARMLPLAQALHRRGHRVEIWAPPVQNPQDAGHSAVYAGVSVTHTPLPTLPGPLGVAQQVGALAWPVLHHQPDIVHVFKPKGYSGLAALLVRSLRPRTPLVVDTDDWEGWGGWNDALPYPQLAKHLFAWQERSLPRRAAAVSVASRTLQTQVWGFGVPPERVVYLPNGIDASANQAQPAPPNADTLLLYTRFWEFDVRDLVAALVAIVQARPATRLLVVGKGERGEEQTMLQLAQRAGVAHAIEYRGWVEPAELPALLGSAAAALVPMDDTLINRARSSAKLLELMSYGLPVVAGRVGEVAEYIEHEQSGLLVPPSDPAGLARGAVRLLGDPALRQRLGAAARERVASLFSWDRLAAEAERAYTVALEG